MTDLSNSVSSIVFHDAYQYFEERFNVKVFWVHLLLIQM